MLFQVGFVFVIVELEIAHEYKLFLFYSFGKIGRDGIWLLTKLYSKEFKLDAISLALDQGYTRPQAASSLGINVNMLRRWIQEQQSDDGHAFRGNGKLTPDHEEIRTSSAA